MAFDYVTREERHYCAVLFAWLFNQPDNTRKFLGKIYPKKTQSEFGDDFKIYFEYTFLREFLFEIESLDSKENYKNKFRELLEGDSQKKKPDFVIFDIEHQTIYIFEAKFEERFNAKQIQSTFQYGELVKSHSENKIKEFNIVVLGQEKFLKEEMFNEVKCKFSKISWEKVVDLMGESSPFAVEIKQGINFQNRKKPIRK